MHLGATPWRLSSRVDARELARQGALAEAWGFSSFWLPESHFSGDVSIPEPLLALAAVAARTQRIRLGTTSYLLPLRHPLHAAEQVAVLDRLSNGRVILGVGRGYQPAMFEAFSVPRQQKRRIFECSLEAIKRAWRGEAVAAAQGETPVTLAPLPVQQPHPPLWVAAFGPKALAQAGRLGLPYLASPMETKARLGENLRRHAEACVAGGVARPPEVPIMRTLFVSEDASLVERVRDRLEGGATPRARNGVPARDWAILGTPAEVRDQVAAYVEAFGMTHLVATRLRIGGVPTEQLERSARLAAEALVG